MLYRTGDPAVLAEIQERVLAKAIQPNAMTGVAVPDAHRNQSNMRVVVTEMERSRHNFSGDRYRDRAKRIGPAVFTGEHNFRTPASAGGYQAEIRSLGRMRTQASCKSQ